MSFRMSVCQTFASLLSSRTRPNLLVLNSSEPNKRTFFFTMSNIPDAGGAGNLFLSRYGQVVEPDGIEPTTYWLQTSRSPN